MFNRLQHFSGQLSFGMYNCFSVLVFGNFTRRSSEILTIDLWLTTLVDMRGADSNMLRGRGERKAGIDAIHFQRQFLKLKHIST